MLSLLLAALAVQPAPPRAVPGELRTFRDWAVGCDNGRNCRAVALGPEGGDLPAVVIAVARGAGPAGAVTLQLSGEAEFAGRVTLVVDGRPVAAGVARDGEVTIAGPAAAAAARAVAMGTRGEARSGTRAYGRFSLAGAAAALRYIDAEQGRAGSVTALIARGNAPAAAVPTPRLPVVHRAPANGAPAPLTRALIAAMEQQAACSARAREVAGSVATHALGAGRTLVLFPCQMGAYNSVEAIFVMEGGRARPALFDSDVPMSDNEAVPVILNAGFDDGVLGGFGKGRGLGDCGIREGHVWDGRRFRLVDRAEMRECRGTRELIPTWRAVVR